MEKISEKILGNFTVRALTKADNEIIKRIDEKSGRVLCKYLKDDLGCLFGLFDNTLSDKELIVYGALSYAAGPEEVTLLFQDIFVYDLADPMATELCSSFISMAIDIKIHNVAIDFDDKKNN